jgi:hypothetical protein
MLRIKTSSIAATVVELDASHSYAYITSIGLNRNMLSFCKCKIDIYGRAFLLIVEG